VNSLEAALRRVASELDARGRRWALVGGLAVSARAEPRTTRDVDIVVDVQDDADAEDLDDLRSLLRESSDADLAEARQAVRTIEARGFHRERPLAESLEAFLREEKHEKA
jgi:hypothetical protein